MKQEILDRIRALGGHIAAVEEPSLQAHLEAIVLKMPLYPKPADTPWARAEETEPIIGLSEYIQKEAAVCSVNSTVFFEKMLEYYFSEEAPPSGQAFFQPVLFTPFREGSADCNEWKEQINEQEVQKVVQAYPLEFMKIAWSYGYPDAYYICLSDVNPENPMVYGTDHETFFNEIEAAGSLLEFLNSFYTKKELIDEVKRSVPW